MAAVGRHRAEARGRGSGETIRAKNRRYGNLMGLFILYSVLSTRKWMYDVAWDQPGLLGTRWSPNPPCWSYNGYVGVRITLY